LQISKTKENAKSFGNLFNVLMAYVECLEPAEKAFSYDKYRNYLIGCQNTDGK
jgi:hypothetical protein